MYTCKLHSDSIQIIHYHLETRKRVIGTHSADPDQTPHNSADPDQTPHKVCYQIFLSYIE